MAFWHKWFTCDSGEVDVWPMVEFPGNVTPVEIERLPEPKAEEPAPFVPPEPDLSTKPDSVFSFEIGFWCPEGHTVKLVDAGGVDSEMQRRIQICPVCGKKAKLAVLKATVVPKWRAASWSEKEIGSSEYLWHYDTWCSTHEFVRWLKKPTGK